jgi:hypothetical protein
MRPRQVVTDDGCGRVVLTGRGSPHCPAVLAPRLPVFCRMDMCAVRDREPRRNLQFIHGKPSHIRIHPLGKLGSNPSYS